MKLPPKTFDDERIDVICSFSNAMFFEYDYNNNHCSFKNSENVLGYSEDELMDFFNNNKETALNNIVHPDNLVAFNKLMNNGEHKIESQIKILCKDKKYHNFTINRIYTKDANGNKIVMGCLWNIDNKYLNIKEIKTGLTKDEMTGLLNKASTISLIEKLQKEVLRDCESSFIFIDIDNFKQINDKYGHSFGDSIIIYVANLIKEMAFADNVVGRFGGDEFIVFIPNVTSRELVTNAIQKLINEVKNYKNPISETFAMTLSVGITFEHCTTKTMDMFNHADKALYTSKLLGKGQYAVYNDHNTISPTDSNIVDLYEKNEFFRAVDELLEQNNNYNNKYIMVSICIENQTLFNKWYGAKRGQQYLNHLVKFLISMESKYKGLFGYFGSNEFCLFLPNKKHVIEEIENGCRLVAKNIGNTVVFLPAIGIYETQEEIIPANLMYHKSTEAQKQVYNNFEHRTKIYSDENSNTLENEIMLILKFKKALENDELQVYIQPKVDIFTKQVVGGEALVRWICSDGTIIYPNEFIPVLEKYAIMYQADMFCWEKLFKNLNKWQSEENIVLSPVSINISKSDITSIDVAKCLETLTEKYNIDRRLIRIEITETVYTKSKDILIIENTIKKLKKLGFLIFMDDFGSGYSSLSLLKNLNFDALKIDMEFLAPTGNKKKGIHILESVVQLAHSIDLPVVAEGVETEAQEKYLKSINCRFAQGYYYYKPMPIEEFKKIIAIPQKVNANGIIGYWKRRTPGNKI